MKKPKKKNVEHFIALQKIKPGTDFIFTDMVYELYVEYCKSKYRLRGSETLSRNGFGRVFKKLGFERIKKNIYQYSVKLFKYGYYLDSISMGIYTNDDFLALERKSALRLRKEYVKLGQHERQKKANEIKKQKRLEKEQGKVPGSEQGV